MSFSCECSAFSGKGLREGPIPCPEESYRLWCVIVCELQTSSTRRPWPALGCCDRKRKKKRKEMLHVLYSIQRVSAYFLAIVM
jgi:hypothetical protein